MCNNKKLLRLFMPISLIAGLVACDISGIGNGYQLVPIVDDTGTTPTTDPITTDPITTDPVVDIPEITIPELTLKERVKAYDVTLSEPVGTSSVVRGFILYSPGVTI